MNKPSDLGELLGKGSLREAAEIICKENKLMKVEHDFMERKYNEIKIKYDILLMSTDDRQSPVDKCDKPIPPKGRLLGH